jgi:hypothetical protein
MFTQETTLTNNGTLLPLKNGGADSEVVSSSYGTLQIKTSFLKHSNVTITITPCSDTILISSSVSIAKDTCCQARGMVCYLDGRCE